MNLKILNKYLFSLKKEEKKAKNRLKTYVIIDAARIKSLTNELTVLLDLKYENLFMDNEAEQLEEVAPYLIELQDKHDFTTWVYDNVYGNFGCIFIHSTQNLEILAEHLRELITVMIEVQHPIKKNETIVTEAYVRFYDPRTFQNFFNSLETPNDFFTNLDAIYVEDKNNCNELLHFTSHEVNRIMLDRELI